MSREKREREKRKEEKKAGDIDEAENRRHVKH